MVNLTKTIFFFIITFISSYSFASSGFKLPFQFGKSVYVTVGNNEYPHSTVAKEYFSWDMRATDRSSLPIVASKAGKVVHLNTDGKLISTPEGKDCVTYKAAYASEANYVILEHSDGTQSVYLHLAENSVIVKLDQQVSQGEILGTIGNTGWSCGTHLHFQVQNKGLTWFSTSISTAFEDVTTDEGVPRSRTSYISGNQLTIVPESFIDGAGSLVDPGNNKDCISNGNFGCSKDTVRLHPHSTSSTALFQVLKQYGQCDYVRVSGLKEAYISVKGWSEQYPGETGLGNSAIYKADALPADIPLTNSDWSIIAVTTTVPIPANSIRDINLECVGGFGIQSWQLKKLTANMSSESNAVVRKLPTQGGYSWGGNGSLITFSNNQIINDTRSNYGRYRDVAKTISGVNAGTVAVFQVYNSPTYACNKLIISNSLVNSSATISWKSWAKATWTGVSTKLPYTILLNGSDYSIIKIEGNFNASNLNATCSP